MSRRAVCCFAIIALSTMTARPGSAQVMVGGGVDYMGYSFEEGLGAESAQLFMVPIALRFPATERLSVDLYSAWAEGRVEQGNAVLKLSGPVDTSIKAAYQATPWALVSLGLSLPTGNSTHDGEEAIVASVLSTDLLGFREASWGTGLAITSSVASATTAGGFGLGIAAAYAMRGSFEPSQDVALSYQPGNEARIRVGLDRNFGASTLTAGATLVSYAKDQADDRNLFQAGQRIRLDASYAFRASSGVWTVYAADLMRANGDLSSTSSTRAGRRSATPSWQPPSRTCSSAGSWARYPSAAASYSAPTWTTLARHAERRTATKPARVGSSPRAETFQFASSADTSSSRRRGCTSDRSATSPGVE